MRRVVVTGMGIVSSIGNNTQEVLASLREAKSGIVKSDRYAELGFRCQVHGAPTLDPEAMIDRRAMRFHGGGTAWNHVAMDQAILDAGLSAAEISSERTGIIMGSGGPSTRTLVEAADTARSKGPKKIGPFAVPKAMSSTPSATLGTWFKIKGVNYSITSACATSNHCIGNAYEMIQYGKQDLMFAGGCEELDWTLSVPWVRCRPPITISPPRRPARMIKTATGSLSQAAPVSSSWKNMSMQKLAAPRFTARSRVMA
jgi:3-oxoacyl-[acyl-carrier-protein] synthase-1